MFLATGFFWPPRPVLREMGWGEGSLTLTLSHAYVGEGTREWHRQK